MLRGPMDTLHGVDPKLTKVEDDLLMNYRTGSLCLPVFISKSAADKGGFSLVRTK
jgi:hypothetical protein